MKNQDNYNNWLYNQIEKTLKGDVLEIGCGLGTMTNLIIKNKKVKSITGLDINQKNINEFKKNMKNKKNILVKNKDISKNITGLKKYDCVVCINVLEHIEYDNKTLINIKKLLKNEGKVILILPAVSWAYGQVDKADNHYRRYDKKPTIYKLKKANFKIIKIKYMNFLGLLGWLYHGKIKKISVHKKNDLTLFNKIVPVLKKIEKIINPPIGLSLVVVGLKNDD